jgi:hypothetical protein
MVPPFQQGISNVPSAMRPVSHGEGLPAPEPPKEYHIDSDGNEERICDGGEPPEPSTLKVPEFVVNMASNEPHRFTQNEVSYLIRDLDLSKGKAEILASWLQH